MCRNKVLYTLKCITQPVHIASYIFQINFCTINSRNSSNQEIIFPKKVFISTQQLRHQYKWEI